MWKYLFILSLFFVALPTVSAQGSRPAVEREEFGPRHERIRTVRQAFLTEKLALSAKEAEAFFPVFWSFQDRMEALRGESPVRWLRRPSGREHLATMTEAQAREAILQLRNDREKILALSAEAEQAYLRILPAKKVLMVELAEREFRKRLLDKLSSRRDRGN